MPIDIRTITDDEVDAFRDTLIATFGGDADDGDPDGSARFLALVDRSQAWAAFDQERIVATAATFNLDLGLPGGGTLAMAGLTMVTVRPSHRRRGLMRELVRLHLDDARRRAATVSGLWASAATIYGRFGYGIAAEGESLTIDAADRLTVAAGREVDDIEWIDEAAARSLLPSIYARATADRPGVLRRSPVWWRERRFLEAAFVRGGASRRRHVVARRGAELVGYVAFRQRGAFENGRGAGTVDIIELVGIDARAEATLWRFALSIDLFPSVTWSNAPTDGDLPWIVSDRRHVRRQRMDSLWLRIDDVAAALAARSYPGDGALRFAVAGTTFELSARDGRAVCAATSGEPELAIERTALGSLYLGAATATALARAGAIAGSPAAVERADRLFAWPIAPWCPEVF